MAITNADLHFSGKRVALVDISSTDYTPPFRVHAICMDAAGALKITTAGGDTVTIPSGIIPAGQQHILDIAKIFKTGTGTQNMVVYGD